MCCAWVLSRSVKSDSLQSLASPSDPMDCSPPGSSVHGDSPGNNTGVGCHALLTGLPNPGIEARCPTLYVDSLLPELPPKLEWVAYPFFGGTAQSRNQTGVSGIVDEFFTS